MTVFVTVAFRPFGTLQILNVSQYLPPLRLMTRVIMIGYLVSFLKLIVCFVLPTIHTVASRPGGYRLMNSLWFLLASVIMPARNAALNSVVEVVQMPPPNAPVTVIFPPSMALPGPTPGALRRLPTSFQKSNLAPAGTTVPCSTVAGPSMFPPKWLLMMCWYQTLYELMTFIFGAKALASTVVSFGAMALTTSSTGDAAAPVSRAAISLMIAAFMPAALSFRPSWLAPVATMRPPTSLRPASLAA